MVKRYLLRTPLREDDIRKLRVGDVVYLSGKVFTLRDRGAKKLLELLSSGARPPVDLGGAAVYHAGPLVRRCGGSWEVISAGPTTSTRMERYDPELIARGVRAIIGKGRLLEGTREACRKHGAAYMVYPGGCGALAAKSIKKVVSVCWLELGVPEAIWILEVEDFGPLYVAIDSEGRDLYLERKESVNIAREKILEELRNKGFS